MKSRLFFGAIIVALFLVGVSLTVHAETVNCTSIRASSLPYTISSPGIYCLTANLTSSILNGAAITISTDNVVIDLNGFELRANAVGNNATGIYAQDRKDAVIKNGAINGFYRAIHLEASQLPKEAQGHHIIEGMRISMADNGFGIRVDGVGCIIRNNMLNGLDSLSYRGIIVQGPATRISGNDIWNVRNGIYASSGDGIIVDGNKIGCSSLGEIGIRGDNANRIAIVSNRIVSMDTGLLLNDMGKYRDNVTVGCTVPYSGGIDIGNNY